MAGVSGHRASATSATVPLILLFDLQEEYLPARRVLKLARRIAATTPAEARQQPAKVSQVMVSQAME